MTYQPELLAKYRIRLKLAPVLLLIAMTVATGQEFMAVVEVAGSDVPHTKVADTEVKRGLPSEDPNGKPLDPGVLI